MRYIGSRIGISDDVIIDDINYEAIPGPSFTPGIGGTYKQSPPPFKPPVEEPAQFDIQEPSPGCEHTLSAGWGTVGFCTPKKVTCNLDRPYEPQRRIEPLRDPFAYEKEQMATKAETSVLKNNDIILKLVLAMFVVYIILGRILL